MTRTKLDTPAFADQSVDTRTISDGTIQNQDISGSISNDKLANSSFTINGSPLSLGASTSIVPFLDWQAVTVADGSTTLTAVAGRGYFLDTNAGVIEVFLPTSPNRGDTIGLVDYSGTFATNQLIINTGGNLIDSTSGPDFKVNTNNSIVELVFVDANKGWQVILNQAAGTTPSSVVTNSGTYTPFTHLAATGGTVTESGDYKIHTFTGDGCFVVAFAGAGTTASPSIVDYLVVAGGGGGGGFRAGGAGGGGFRESLASASPTHTASPHSASPLKATTGITVTATTFPISVGAGGSGGSGCGSPGTNGSNSVFSTITSAGGGGGGSYDYPSGDNGLNGGSGGGGGAVENSPTPNSAGSGNTPPVSPPQGQNGGSVSLGPVGGGNAAAGGGGAGGTGAPRESNSPTGGPGGNGVASSITGSPVTRSGGGGGGAGPGSLPGGTGGTGGAGNGGGGPGAAPTTGQAGTANTGGGGGGSGNATTGGAGGKGVVIIRYKFKQEFQINSKRELKWH